MNKIKAFVTRLSADCGKLLGDLWHVRGMFARLAHVSRWRLLLVECALLVIVCGGFHLLRHDAAVARGRQALRAAADELKAVVLELEAEKRELGIAEARCALLGGLILDKEARARLLSELTDPTTHPGLEIVSISPQPSSPRERYTPHRSLISMEGGFDDLLRFLRHVESEGTPCSVVAVDVQSIARERRIAGHPAPDSARIPGVAVRSAPSESVRAGGAEQCRERISLLIETYAEADAPVEGAASKR